MRVLPSQLHVQDLPFINPTRVPNSKSARWIGLSNLIKGGGDNDKIKMIKIMEL
jgi:hypothetical protein